MVNADGCTKTVEIVVNFTCLMQCFIHGLPAQFTNLQIALKGHKLKIIKGYKYLLRLTIPLLLLQSIFFSETEGNAKESIEASVDLTLRNHYNAEQQ